MPQQLIYTSAPRGLVAGRSGHCTVARSAAMREPLMLRLEQLSYYHHLSLTGGQDRPIFAYRIIDIRGSRFHVLSRIQDAGLDFTGRTNFIAHHLALAPEELKQFTIPPVILRDWAGWVKSWTKEPQMLENEDWSSLKALAGKTSLPAQTWHRVTGDAVNGYGLLDARPSAAFLAGELIEEVVLKLFAESLELLEVRDTGRDSRAASWQYTFTTSMQEQDNPADFRWRCIHSDNPAVSRLTPPGCHPLAELRANKWSGEEVALAQTGRQPPRFIIEPQDVKITEGGAARLQAKAEGVPSPAYQWFSVNRANSGEILANETKPELELKNPPFGVSRYIVRASNSAGEITSKVVTLSVEQKLRLAPVRTDAQPSGPAKVVPYQKSDEDIERQRKRLQAEQAKEWAQKRSRRNKAFIAILAVALIGAAGTFGWKNRFFLKKLAGAKENGSHETNGPNALPSSNTATLVSENKSNASSNPTQLAEGKTASDESKSKAERSVNLLALDENRLPDGWTQKLIGTVSNTDVICLPGKDSTLFNLRATATGFRTNGDNFMFVCKTNAGREFTATLQKIDPLSTSGRYGIMIRESLEPQSPFLFIGTSPQKIIAYRRDIYAHMFTNEIEILPANQNKPIMLRFQQKTNQFVPAYSVSSVNYKEWLSLKEYSISGNDQWLVGFALCSESSSNQTTAHFLDISPTRQK